MSTIWIFENESLPVLRLDNSSQTNSPRTSSPRKLHQTVSRRTTSTLSDSSHPEISHLRKLSLMQAPQSWTYPACYLSGCELCLNKTLHRRNTQSGSWPHPNNIERKTFPTHNQTVLHSAVIDTHWFSPWQHSPHIKYFYEDDTSTLISLTVPSEEVTSYYNR